jgi:hypothetical protein
MAEGMSFFRVIENPDADGNGLPDYWEILYFGKAGQKKFGDPDGDGIGNIGEYRAGTDPLNADSDADGMLDKWEIDNNLDAIYDDSQQDTDRDGFTNIEEFRAGTNPLDSESFPVLIRESYDYPQLALGGGYECIVMISNRTGNRWEGAGYLYSGSTEKWTTRWSIDGTEQYQRESFPISLPARSTKKYVLSGDDTVRTGFLRIVSNNGHSRKDVALAFFYNYKQSGALVDSTGVPFGSPSDNFLFPVEKTSSVNTGFAWAPATYKKPTNITAQLYDSLGDLVQEKILTFEGHLAQFFSEIFDVVPDGFLGSVTLSADESFHLTVIRLEFTQSGFQLTSVPPGLSGEGAGKAHNIYSQLALGGGYECILLVSNHSNSNWAGSGYVLQGQDQSWSAPWSVNGTDYSGSFYFPVQLESGATVKYLLSGDQEVRPGYLKISPETGFDLENVTFAFFYNYSSKQGLADSTGTPIGIPSKEFVFPVEGSSTINTGFAWVSPDELSSFKITFNLYNSVGAIVQEQTRNYQGHSALFFNDLFDQVPSDFVGQVEIAAENALYLTVIRLELTPDGFQMTSVPAEGDQSIN